MERDREGERAVSDLRGLEPCAVHPMQGPTQDELVADENSIVNLGRIEVDPARPSEIGAERFLHPAGLDVDTDASRPDPERSTAKSWDRANARMESRSPDASSSQTRCASPKRRAARSTGPVVSSRRSCGPNVVARTSTRSAAIAASASARGRVGCSPDNSMKIRTPVERGKGG